MQRGRGRPAALISLLAASRMCGAAAWMSRKGAVQCTAGAGRAQAGQLAGRAWAEELQGAA